MLVEVWVKLVVAVVVESGRKENGFSGKCGGGGDITKTKTTARRNAIPRALSRSFHHEATIVPL